jgi:hypothetical protein
MIYLRGNLLVRKPANIYMAYLCQEKIVPYSEKNIFFQIFRLPGGSDKDIYALAWFLLTVVRSLNVPAPKQFSGQPGVDS